MNTQSNIIIRKHVEAIVALTLGNRRMKSSLAILAGEPMDMAAHVQLAQLGAMSHTDSLYVEFDGVDTPTPVMTGITIIAPRDMVCHIQTGCQLYLSKSGTRAVLLPKDNVRGLFRAAPGEIIHIDRKPIDAEAGILRAQTALRKLVMRGVDVRDRADIFEVPEAA